MSATWLLEMFVVSQVMVKESEVKIQTLADASHVAQEKAKARAMRSAQSV